MDISLLQTIWTVAAFIVFVAIVVWAYSSKRSKQFDEAANLPFSDKDKAIHEKTNGEQSNV